MNHPTTQPSNMSENNTDSDSTDNDHDVENPDHRWHGLSTVVGLLVALHYPALAVAAAGGYVDLSAIPQAWWFFDTLGWVGTMTYIFGEDTIKAARQAMGKKV